MVFNDKEEVIAFIKMHQTPKRWVTLARENHKTLNALVFGKKFAEVLIEKIEKIESKDRAISRKKYSKDIRDMFHRVMQPRTAVFSASGGSVSIDIDSKANKDKFVQHLSKFKGQKSIKSYLSENFFKMEDVDPNGIIFMEYLKDEKISPTYKSINDIRAYMSDGQLLDVIIFEPITIKKKHSSSMAHVEWRIVDNKTDWRFMQKGNSYVLIEDKTFEHPFGRVPAVVLSDIQQIGSELRMSPLFFIKELAKEYARDKSIKTIYKFLHGFPKHWRYESKCRTCHGTGKDGTEPCEICNGKGNLRVNDVTDVTIIETPREDDPIIAPNVEGFVAPDLATWKQFNTDLQENEDLIDSTMWGTGRVKKTGNETATGRFIDVQPVMNKLGRFTDNVEFVHNQLARFVENWVNGMPTLESQYHITYGRRFIIESPDVVLDKYTEAREKGDNNTVLDKLLDEYILSKYQSNPMMLGNMQLKRLVEPYIHQSIKEVSDIFGSIEANRIVLFVPFWEQVDTIGKTHIQLKQEFDTYFESNNKISQPSNQ